MPTGPAHMRKVAIAVDADYNEQALTVPCRCTIGYDHDDAEIDVTSYDEEGEKVEPEFLSDADAQLIWIDSGMDEVYDFRR